MLIPMPLMMAVKIAFQLERFPVLNVLQKVTKSFKSTFGQMVLRTGGPYTIWEVREQLAKGEITHSTFAIYAAIDEAITVSDLPGIKNLESTLGYLCIQKGCTGEGTHFPEAVAQALGMKCPVCGSELTVKFSTTELVPATITDNPYSDWPTPIALPLQEYDSESHPGAKLWAAFDAFEMLTRLMVFVFIGEQSQEGKLEEKQRIRLSRLIESPTFGSWFVMAQDLAGCKGGIPELGLARKFVATELKDLLYGPEKPGSDETSFLQLRNRMAHGGGMTQKEQARLLGLWEGRINSALASLNWIVDWKLLGMNGQGQWIHIKGEIGSPLSETKEEPEGEPDAVWLEIGQERLLLWPLTAFGIPTIQKGDKAKTGSLECTQVYVRKETVRLGLVPLGVEGMGYSESSADAVAAFEGLFNPSIIGQRTKFKIHDFEREIRKDAGEMVGRSEELAILERMVKERKAGVLWLSGQAGMGKSFLMAKLAVDLLDGMEGAGRVFLPYRFRAGEQDRCNREAFAQFVIERLVSAGVLAEYFEDKPKEKAQVRLQNSFDALEKEALLVLIVDGLDEVGRRDTSFAEELPLALHHPRVLWVCSGRPESGIGAQMKRLGAEILFPDGLPPMQEADIRGMILEKIGPLRKKLLVGDREEGDVVINPFIKLVTERASGLPTYVKYVIGDVLSGRYRVLDGDEDLPESLYAYHEELLRRLGIGDLQAVLTPLAATLATANEPLALHELTAILSFRKILIGEDSEALVEQGLAAMESMITTASDPEGEVGYQLFHQSLRDHILQSAHMTHGVSTSNQAFGDLAGLDNPPSEIRTYLIRCGVRHLLESGRDEAAESKLLDLDHLYGMHQQGIQWYEIYRYWEQLGGAKRAIQYVDLVLELIDWPTDDLEVPDGEEESDLDLYQSTDSSLLEKLDFLLFLALEAKWIECSTDLSFILLQSRLETLGEDHPDIAAYYALQGHAFVQNSQWFDAIDSYQKALAIGLKTHGENHPDIAAYYSGIGDAELQSGHANLAMESYDKSLTIRAETLGMDHPDVATSFNDLGSAYFSAGLGGLEFYLRSLAIRLKTLGEDHLDVATSYNNIGLVYQQNDFLNEAVEYYKKSLAIRLKTLGKHHLDVAISYTNLGNAYGSKGEYDMAFEYLEKSLVIRLETLGEDHPDVATSFDDLGMAHESDGNSQSAFEYKAMAKWSKFMIDGQFLSNEIDPYLFKEQVGIDYERAREILDSLNGDF